MGFIWLGISSNTQFPRGNPVGHSPFPHNNQTQTIFTHWIPPFRLKTSALRLTNFCFLGTLQGLYFIDSNMLAQIGRFGRALNYLLGVVRNFWGGRFVFVAVFFLFFTVGSLMCLGRYKTKRKFGKNRFQASL